MALSLCAERDNAAVDTHTTDELVDKGSVQMPLQSPPSAGYKSSRVDSRSASTAAAVTQCGSANVCDVCGRRFARRQNLLHHRAMHNAELRRYSCAQCGLRFAWKQTLDRHVLSHSRSPDALSVECPVCHRRFRKHSLSGHIRRMHVGGKHHGCVTCGKLFFQKSELAAHAKSHSHEKRHACSLCSKCFKHSFHLARHVKSAHNVDDKTNGGENN